MKTINRLVMAALLAAPLIAVGPAHAGSEICGSWAFGGAFKNYNSAVRRANRLGGNVLDLDKSDSPNAGKGFWVVGKGPGSAAQARRWARNWKNRGISGAYSSYRCFIGV